MSERVGALATICEVMPVNWVMLKGTGRRGLMRLDHSSSTRPSSRKRTAPISMMASRSALMPVVSVSKAT